MRLKLFSLLAALALVAACETAPEDTGSTAGSGGATTSSSSDVASSSQTTASSSGSSGSSGSEAPVKKSPAEQLSDLGDLVFFDLDKFNLKPVARARVRDWANFLKDNPALMITLEGNCDERGTREYNLALGSRRAHSVRDFLVGLGIDAKRITTISYGKERPIALGSNAAAWSKNRNVHIVVN